MKLSTENRIEVVGYVTNYVIKEPTKKGGKKRANITIKDKLTNNVCFVTLFDRDKIVYGSKDDKREVTLGGLQKIFMDGEKKPKNVLVSAIGSTSDFVTDDGKTFESQNIFFISPYDNEENQKIIFRLKGIVENVQVLEDNDGKDYAKIKVGTLNVRPNGNEKLITGVQYKTVTVRDEAYEKIEDVEKLDLVDLKGDILNILPKKDKYGDFIGSGTKEYATARASIICVEDDIDEEDLAIYKKAKKLGKGQSIKITEASADDDDDFDDEDFD